MGVLLLYGCCVVPVCDAAGGVFKVLVAKNGTFLCQQFPPVSSSEQKEDETNTSTGTYSTGMHET